MKRNKLSVLPLCALLCTVLTACTGPEGAQSPASGNVGLSSSPVSAAGEPKPESQSASSAGEAGAEKPVLRWFSGINEGCGAAQGYYRIKSEYGDERASSRISYLDYASKTEVPLCNQPQCAHNNERCTAMLYADFDIDTKLVALDQKLYVFSTKQPKPQGSGGEGGFVQVSMNMALYQMNADGTDRTELLEIGEEYQLGNELAAGNGFLIISAVKATAEAVVAQPVILKIDIARKSMEELQLNGTICGVSAGKIVVNQTNYGDLRGLPDEQALAAIEKSKNTVVTYDPATGAAQEHAAIPANDITNPFVFADRVFYSSRSNEILYVDLNTNESGLVTNQLSGKFTIESQADGKMVCSFSDGAALNAQTVSCKMVDCNSGSVAPFSLYTRQSVSKHPVAILADTGGSYFVKSDIVEKEEYVEWAGTSQISILSEGYSLISKEDYWASNGSYEPVAMLD